MKIAHKLILSYFLIAALGGVTVFLANRSYQRIDLTFDELSNTSIPKIEALEELKQSALTIISSATEYAFIRAESARSSRGELQEDLEEAQISRGLHNYEQALAKYEPLVNQSSQTEFEFLRRLKSSGNDVIRLSAELIEAKRNGLAGEEAIEKKEKFEEAEELFVEVADQALAFEHSELARKDHSLRLVIGSAQSMMLGIGLFALALSLVVGIFIARSVSRPVNELKEASKQIGEGNLDTVVEIKSRDEFRDLARSFNKMTAHLKQSRIEILHAKNFVDNIIGSMTDVVIVTDMEGNITRANLAASRLCNYDENELVTQALESFGAPLSNRKAGLRAIESAGSIELTCNGPTGGETSILFSVAIIHDFAGKELGFVCLARDITRIKEAELQVRASLNEKEVLLKEIHHRVKNNLQVISSLLNLQSRQLTDPKTQTIFRESQDRVRSMALIHETLYQSQNFSEIKFDDYISKLIAQISRSHRVSAQSIKLEHVISDVALDIDAAVPCGLLINELVTNALKHAFPSGQHGEVLVDFRSLGEGYRLQVSDNGIGFKDSAEAADAGSLGLKLVASLTEQLGGQLELERNGGTKFTINFPKTLN